MRAKWLLLAVGLIVIVFLGKLIIVDQGFLSPDPITKANPAVSEQERDRLYGLFQTEVAELIKQYDEDLASYRENLDQQGKQRWDENYQEEQQLVKERLAKYQEELSVEAKEYAAQLRKEYQNPIVNLQLQLAIVSLSSQERQQKLEKLQELQATYDRLLKAKDEELIHKREEYHQMLLQESSNRLAEVEADLESEINREYDTYRQERKHRLDQQIRQREDALGRALQNREY